MKPRSLGRKQKGKNEKRHSTEIQTSSVEKITEMEVAGKKKRGNRTLKHELGRFSNPVEQSEETIPDLGSDDNRSNNNLCDEGHNVSDNVEIKQKSDAPGIQETNTFRKEIADMPMGEILKLREKLGSKLYNKLLFGKTDPETADETAENACSTSKGMTSNKQQQFKREHRKRPREVSAKKPVWMRRDVFSLAKKEKWDPRFHSDTGEYSEDHFKKNYSFVRDLQKQEKEILKKEVIPQLEDDETVSRVADVIQRMENKERSDTQKAKLKELRRKNMERMKEGKNPVFLKKSELRKQALEEKFLELKKKGKLDKYLKRKSKKQKSALPLRDGDTFW